MSDRKPTLKTAPGSRVCYKPSHAVTDCYVWEFGRVIREGSSNFIFVLFDGEKHAKAVYRRDLWNEYD